tara:strand:+ start:148985 stop:149344 length:360 start_codon:yes stop_codon:yes gene_type:complete
MTNPHNGKDISDIDVHPIVVHNDELMAMIGYLRTVLGEDWDYPSCGQQEIFDLYLYHRFDMCRGIITTHSKRKALADHLLLELDDRIFRHNDTDIYQAHEAMWRITGDGPYEFELLKGN